MTESVARLRGDQLTLGYGKFTVAENLNVSIPDGHFTAIIGPNGCGKSTLLRTLSRLMTPANGKVWLDGEHIQHYASKEVARRIGLLAQNATTPGDITVQELVARGRYPHQPLFTRWRQRMKLRSQTPCRRRVSPPGITKCGYPFRRTTSTCMDCDGAGAGNVDYAA
jgi:iron complex transport system ATP-binding protein